MEIIYSITVAQGQRLPRRMSYGSHTSGPGWSGYYILGAPDTCIAIVRPDLDEVDESAILHAIADALSAACLEATLAAE